jgi:hypothetical protein
MKATANGGTATFDPRSAYAVSSHCGSWIADRKVSAFKTGFLRHGEGGQGNVRPKIRNYEANA